MEVRGLERDIYIKREIGIKWCRQIERDWRIGDWRERERLRDF